MSKLNGSTDQPKISIALATCNGEKFLKDQIDSLLNQTTKPFEIIVCDDRSSDSTIEILEHYRSRGLLKSFLNEERLGVARNFQKAVSLCSGDYIALSDQDDVWLPSKLERSIEKIRAIELPELPCLVYTDLEVVNDKLEMVEPSFWKYLKVNPEQETFKSMLYGNVVTGCTVTMNRACKKYFSEMPANVFMHDQWMGLVAYGLGKVGIINETTVKYRRHETNNTQLEALSAFGKIKRSITLSIKEYKNSTFLDSEIFQANLFYELYKNELSVERCKDLSDFFKETKTGFVQRKFRKILAKRFNHLLR